jgi:hypothetical protein
MGAIGNYSSGEVGPDLSPGKPVERFGMQRVATENKQSQRERQGPSVRPCLPRIYAQVHGSHLTPP